MKVKRLHNGISRQLPLVFLFVFLAFSFLSPAGAAEPAKAGPFFTPVEINTTNTSLDPAALPPEFRETREQVVVKTELNETVLAAPKGEMAAGPRSIGFSFDPLVIAAAVIAIVVIGAGILYYRRKNRDQEEKV